MKNFLKKFLLVNFTFSGRLNLSDYWIYGFIFFWLTPILLIFKSIAILIISGELFSISNPSLYAAIADFLFENIFPFLIGIFIFLWFVKVFATNIKRLHDQNKSGFLSILYFVPILFWYILFINFLCEGIKGSNNYGPEPIKRV